MIVFDFVVLFLKVMLLVIKIVHIVCFFLSSLLSFLSLDLFFDFESNTFDVENKSNCLSINNVEAN